MLTFKIVVNFINKEATQFSFCRKWLSFALMWVMANCEAVNRAEFVPFILLYKLEKGRI